MLMTALSYCILLLSSFILISFHPIFMGILILVLCLFISITMSLLTHSWLSFILFYLMSGGILMLLIYMSCYSFNPIFKKSLFFVLMIAISSFVVFKQHPFLYKKSFSIMMLSETGNSLSYDINMSMFILISLFMFLCFFNISKMLTSMSFSMRKLYLSSNTSTANSCLYLKMPSYFKMSPILLLKDSPWPIIASVGSFFVVSGAIMLFHKNIMSLLLFGLFFVCLAVYQWSRDLVREGSMIGGHTKFFQKALKVGMMLFILSEVMFFASFFWGYFHSSTVPCVEIGVTWPPFGISAINPYGIPLLNTVILLSSGVSVTWSHHSLQKNNFEQSFYALIITCLLGWVFLKIQMEEYSVSTFTFADSVFGSIFFMATGFHGLHVFLGSVLLSISGFRLFFFHFSDKHHVGYEAAIWYWHFVDVVWLFLYCFVYFWGY